MTDDLTTALRRGRRARRRRAAADADAPGRRTGRHARRRRRRLARQPDRHGSRSRPRRKGLVRIGFRDEYVYDELAERLSPRVVEAPARLDSVRRQLDEYFEQRRKRVPDHARLLAHQRRLPPPGARGRPPDPAGRDRDLRRPRRRGRQPARGACRRHRDGDEPDPDRRALPSRRPVDAAGSATTAVASRSRRCSWTSRVTARPWRDGTQAVADRAARRGRPSAPSRTLGRARAGSGHSGDGAGDEEVAVAHRFDGE